MVVLELEGETLTLMGNASEFYPGEYHEIVVGPRQTVEEVFIGEDSRESLAD